MKRLLLVGWDAADWKVISPLMEEGMMPNVKALVERGVKGNMATMYPMLSPMLWTSIATGKRAFNHGIYGFSEPDPKSHGVRPITNLSRTTRAIWNIATLMGMKSNVVGWWPSHPAEAIDGVMASDFYQKATVAHGEPWPMRPGAIHPERLVENLAKLRVHPQDLEGGLVQLFLPKLFEMDQEKDRRVTQVAKEIAECTTICNAAEALMQFEPWDITCAYFASIDHFCHGFMNFYPPRMEWVNEEDYELYNEVVRSGYIYHDILLGRLLKQTDDDTVVILMSDHGFHSDHLRPRDLPDEPAGPAEQHRHYGIFVMAGPNIKQDELVFGTTLLSVCPTALAALDLPVGEDMEGRVLMSVFEDPPDVSFIASWDDVEGRDGMHPRDKVLDPVDAEESMRQLVELGYIDAPPENAAQAVDECVRELRYNLARAYMEADLHIEALPILEDLHERWPNEFRFGVLLINCCLALDRASEAGARIDAIAESKKKDIVCARKELKEFLEENKEKMEKAREGDPDALTEQERYKLRKLRARSGRNPMALYYLRGVVAAAMKDYDQALKFLQTARKAAQDDLRILLKLGDVYLQLKRFEDAKSTYDRAVELDPENATAWLGIAKALLTRRSATAIDEAVEAAQRSVGLLYHNPMGHYLLGVARLRKGEVKLAVDSLERAVGLNPNFPEAYRRLAQIYEHRLASPAKARKCRQNAVEARKRVRALQQEKKHPVPEIDEIKSPPMPANNGVRFPFVPGETVVLVSGLPRSGTSMMMQMLAAGGVEALTDGARDADESNPRGYWEVEKVKSLAHDNAWLDEAKGKAVKIIANLLPAVKSDLRYKIIFMWRNMEEVLRSQSEMLKKRGGKGDRDFNKLAKTFQNQLNGLTDWLAKTESVDVCFVDYAATVADPGKTAVEVAEFLNGNLDTAAMMAAVRPELHRQKAD